MEMLDITVVILTFNEDLHIERCIKSLLGVVKRIVIVDSFSQDQTADKCKALGAEVYKRKWINYSDQFQWGLDNCEIKTMWTMRMDADEYLEPSLIAELHSKIPVLNDTVNGVYLKRKVMFKGKWIKYGGFYPHILMRVWRTGFGAIEQRWMDEHIIVDGNKNVYFDNDLVDDNLNNIDWWVEKHNGYSTREMIDILNIKYNFMHQDISLHGTAGNQARRKRLIKEKLYSRLPLGVRPLLYFMYRYFFRLGFMDGGKGLIFHFLQGFWYRLLVDIKVAEIEVDISKGGDIREIISTKYGINLTL